MENKTRCYSKEEIYTDIRKYAFEFSGGNKELELLLLYCFQNGIMTHACCKGHSNEITPYIYFDLNENQINLASMIIEDMLKSDMREQLLFSIDQKKDIMEKKHYFLSCRVNDIKYTNVFFSSLMEIIKKYNHTNISSQYKQVFFDLDSINIPKIRTYDCYFDIDYKNISYKIIKLLWLEKYKTYCDATLSLIDGNGLINYMQSLNSLSDYSIDNLYHSYQFDHDNITKLTEVITKLKEPKMRK